VKRAAILTALAVAACGGGDNQAKTPRAHGKLSTTLAAAFKEEATGDPAKAVGMYVQAIDFAGAAPEDPLSVPVAMAALDALVHRNVYAFGDVSSSSALVDRLDAKTGSVDEKLAQVQQRADGPFVAALVANARLALAERRGDPRAASAHRASTGCAREALVAAPVAWASVSGVREPDAFDRADQPLPAQVAGPGPFEPLVVPARVAAFGCRIPLTAQTSGDGVRDVVVDVEIPKGGLVGVGLRASGAATLRVGGKIVLERPFSAGGGPVARFATIDASAGVMRVVVRVGMDQDYSSVEIGAWDSAGKPLRTHAPAPNTKATAVVKRADALAIATPKTNDEKLVVALGALAAKDSRSAESILYPESSRQDAAPDLLLAYARAVRMARDLPTVKSQERARAAYDRVLEAWPASWEAAVEHAVLAGARRARQEANLEAITDLDATRAKTRTASPALLDAFEASTAGKERLYDRAKAAFDRARVAPLLGTPLLRDIERVVFERTGKEDAAFACDANAPSDRSSLSCHHALVAIGDREGAERELERLRALAETPLLYLSISSRSALEAGDVARARTIYEKMNPGDRQLATLYAVKGKAAVPEMLALARTARDAPFSLPSLLRVSGDDPLAAYEGIAEKVTAVDPTADASLANAATAVLAHDEKYDLSPTGLVHFTMLDVRRVMGTTDIEVNAQAGAPMLYGKDTVRVLRRRIFKKDGRIILPDRTPHAAQSHADLSQLEAGDAVEAIYEGWAVPGEIGNIGIDTPDLLPERTAVRDARIELRLPASLRGALWSHPMLGKADDKMVDGKRVIVWHMKEHPIRRLEAGVPKMDRNVCVSFSTTTWDDVARNLRETVAALDADDPEVSNWAHDVLATAEKSGEGKPTPKKIVEAVVAASGQAVKEASGIVLADIDLGRTNNQAITARTSLATHEGSRTWLVVRALRELGIKADVVVAENEPFSDSPNFPPHLGRFMHPLAVAHTGAEDVWIDADVPGPPLPAGRISPELRGRSALYFDGKIAPLPPFQSDGERDEIDERLVVDEQGNAKGSLTVLLRGRAAQDLAEALVHLVGDGRQRALRGIALAWVPFATIEKVELSSSEGSWQVAIRAELTAPAYAQVEGTKAGARTWVLPGIDPIHYVFPRPYVSTLGSTYAAHGARENALAISHAAQYHVRRRIELPAKASIARLPGPFDGKGPLLAAQRKISVNGNSIEEDFTLDVTTGTVPREKYEEFVTQAHRTDDAFRASTRVKPPTP
jgi:hypothetical protein